MHIVKIRYDFLLKISYFLKINNIMICTYFFVVIVDKQIFRASFLHVQQNTFLLLFYFNL